MQALGAAQLLDLWEHGIELSLPRRALALLAASCPDVAAAHLAALTIGRRDALLMQLREHLFGSDVMLTTTCPACAETLESTIALAGLYAADLLPAEIPCLLVAADRDIRFRLPTAGDLIDLPPHAEQACRTLLARCRVASSEADDDPGDVDAWPESDIEAISHAMASADPQAHTDISMICAACAHRWDVAFDIASYLWREIDVWAKRTLREVHALARAYAWREQDILALGPTRRQLYLELSQS